MLAKVFKTAAELGIPDHEHGALCTLLYMAEDGQIKPEQIYMPQFHCGTRHCLAGWANAIDANAFPEIERKAFEMEGNCNSMRDRLPPQLCELFGISNHRMKNVDGKWAIKALRAYLETGKCPV